MKSSFLINPRKKMEHNNNRIIIIQSKFSSVFYINHCLLLMLLICFCTDDIKVFAFSTKQTTITNSIMIHNHHHQQQKNHHQPIIVQRIKRIAHGGNIHVMYSTNDDGSNEGNNFQEISKGRSISKDINEIDTKMKFSNNEQQQPLTTTTDNENSSSSENQQLLSSNTIMTGTVNERLLLELENAARKEKFGSRSSLSISGKKERKFGLQQFITNRKSDKERQLAIEDAKNLNGINPIMGFIASLIAFTCTILLWYGTDTLIEYYTLHPVETSVSNIYFIQRISSVFRNVIIGLISLLSGFFGVTGFGIFLLSIRVTYGIMKGELDPTPPKSVKASYEKQQDTISKSWDYMLNKKPKDRK